MTYIPTNKRYEIETFDQLLSVVNDENFEYIMLDFAKWVTTYLAYMSEIRKAHPELADKSNTEICKCTFIWIDDGKNDFLKAVAINKATGERSELKIK